MFNGRTLAHRRVRRRHDDDDTDDDSDRVEVVIRRRGLSAQQTRKEHNLHIAAFDVSRHEGVYQCLAISSTGSLLSRPALLEPTGMCIPTIRLKHRCKNVVKFFFIKV